MATSKRPSRSRPAPARKSTPASPAVARDRASATDATRTLAIDIGGTGLKAIVLDGAGTPVTERVRTPTPHPAEPSAVLHALMELIASLGSYDRVSVGFPGVVVDGVTLTAHNLDPKWKNFPLAARLAEITGRPTRALNDAGVQGYGVVTGKGLEMLLTFGTGMGCALFYKGVYIPNLELAHHPFRKGKTYEDYVGGAAFAKVGKKRWNERVAKVIEQIEPIWNPQALYLGGGNAKHITLELPPHVKVTSNVAGLLGGIALWHTD